MKKELVRIIGIPDYRLQDEYGSKPIGERDEFSRVLPPGLVKPIGGSLVKTGEYQVKHIMCENQLALRVWDFQSQDIPFQSTDITRRLTSQNDDNSFAFLVQPLIIERPQLFEQAPYRILLAHNTEYTTDLQSVRPSTHNDLDIEKIILWYGFCEERIRNAHFSSYKREPFEGIKEKLL